MLSHQDIKILRGLAREYAEYAFLPKQSERRHLWLSLNSGRMERPMILVDQLPWSELEIDPSLRCQINDTYWGEVEKRLRQTLYKWRHLPVDMVLNPYICLFVPTTETDWGIQVQTSSTVTKEANDVSSNVYINQFKTMEDIEKLKMPTIYRERGAERLLRQQADVIFDGIIPYHMRGATKEFYGFRVGPWDLITQWMGVTNIYLALMDEPEMIHALMSKATDGILGLIEQFNQDGLFDVETNYIHCSHTFSEDLPTQGYDRANPQSRDAWGFGMAQLFSSVSPSITQVFEVDYMQKIFPLMGAIYYGCCERLDDRMDVITKLPNIRKISCSAWSDRVKFAEKMPDSCVMSCKPSPAVLATDTFSVDAARADIRSYIRAAKENHKRIELIMKDISTVRHEPQRIWEWANIAIDEAQRSV